MGAAVAVLSNFERDQWNAEVYGALALASRLSALVKSRAMTISLAYHLRKLNSSFKDFFKKVHGAMEPGAVRKDVEPVTPDRIRTASEDLRKLYNSIESFHLAAKRVGLTNNSLTAGSLRSIHDYSDDILELAELLELALRPEEIQAIYDRASKERESGEIFDLRQLE